MLKYLSYISIIAFILCGFSLRTNAIESQDSTIIDHIKSEAGDKVNIYLPDELLEKLKPHDSKQSEPSDSKPKTGGTMQKVVGFRVQVFSDNNHRTAKSEALVKERNIISRFPQIGTYLSYKPPFWRLRVGDFRTHGEAMEILQQIKREFPGYAREIIIVQDRVNVIL
ncbi:MAG: hypothetical protein RR061_05765 [Muribaculaceae bacterium]